MQGVSQVTSITGCLDYPRDHSRTMRVHGVAHATKTALTIDEIIKSGPLGRTSIYAAIKAGQLTARKFGKRTFVLTSDFEGFFNGLPKVGEGRRFSPPATAPSVVI